jgi:hypothetical protein
MSSARPPARLFVLLARDAPTALVIRRGPSAWCHLVRWDLATDRLEHGAWIRGRIFAERSDLSPDGELLVAFVYQGARARTTYTDAWTAVSRPPWLHALALWPQGPTYGGGGRFTDRRTLVLRACSTATHPDHPAIGLSVSPGDPPVHDVADAVEGADWAGRGSDRRLVFARAGKLYRRDGRDDALVADLGALEPEPAPAPAWAKAPLARTVRAPSARTNRKVNRGSPRNR